MQGIRRGSCWLSCWASPGEGGPTSPVSDGMRGRRATHLCPHMNALAQGQYSPWQLQWKVSFSSNACPLAIGGVSAPGASASRFWFGFCLTYTPL